jgi:hypothetical protein
MRVLRSASSDSVKTLSLPLVLPLLSTSRKITLWYFISLSSSSSRVVVVEVVQKTSKLAHRQGPRLHMYR